jgi:hypothetical protein
MARCSGQPCDYLEQRATRERDKSGLYARANSPGKAP